MEYGKPIKKKKRVLPTTRFNVDGNRYKYTHINEKGKYSTEQGKLNLQHYSSYINQRVDGNN